MGAGRRHRKARSRWLRGWGSKTVSRYFRLGTEGPVLVAWLRRRLARLSRTCAPSETLPRHSACSGTPELAPRAVRRPPAAPGQVYRFSFQRKLWWETRGEEVSKARMHTNAHALAHPWRGKRACWHPPYPRTDPYEPTPARKKRTGAASYRTVPIETMPQTPAKVERKRASMDAIQVPMPAVCGPEKAPCSPDWLPRPVNGWPDGYSPTAEHVAGADDAQPAPAAAATPSAPRARAPEQGSGGFSWPARGIQPRAAGDDEPGWLGGLRG